MKNPGALAGATGANNKADQLRPKAYKKPNRSAMARYAQDRHKRAARILGYALTADAPDVWGQASVIFSARLTEMELASLAFAALRALDEGARELVCEAAAVGGRA
ncbi:hypothetical protein [Haematobacter sp. UBA3484]|nr:hypothetical protein [Haematobacter sp. UBA3484]